MRVVVAAVVNEFVYEMGADRLGALRWRCILLTHFTSSSSSIGGRLSAMSEIWASVRPRSSARSATWYMWKQCGMRRMGVRGRCRGTGRGAIAPAAMHGVGGRWKEGARAHLLCHLGRC